MPPPPRDWILVCGGFHRVGGMDRLNASLALFLASRGTRVHLVGHDIDPEVAAAPGIAVTRVARPAGAFLLGEVALARAAGRLRREMMASGRAPLLLGNGGNADRADVNWVHSVHHAWPCADAGAPAWFRAKNRAFKTWSRRREAPAIRDAAVVIANSRRTKADLLAHLPQLDAGRTHVVYPGSDPAWRPPDARARVEARARWCGNVDRPLVAMIGALGHDVNKGIDVVLDAWRRLASTRDWDAELVVAGPGDTSRWRACASGMDVRFTGHISEAGSLLDAADLLVSPVRYEAYGLAVHEAICRGVPVLVSRGAGIVERFPPGADEFLLDGADGAQLAARLTAWRASAGSHAVPVEQLGARLRAHSLDDMCADIVAAAEPSAHPQGAPA